MLCNTVAEHYPESGELDTGVTNVRPPLILYTPLPQNGHPSHNSRGQLPYMNLLTNCSCLP